MREPSSIPSAPRGGVQKVPAPGGARHRQGSRAPLLAAVLLLMAVPQPASTADDPYDHTARFFRVFRDSEGLPQNTIQAVTRDREGRLWVGTQDGAAVYDGQRWRTVDMPRRLRSNFVRTILGASDGSLWFGTRAAGIFRLHEGRWTSGPEICRMPECERINVLFETIGADGISTVWAGTHGAGLGRYREGRWKQYTGADGLPSETVWALHATPGRNGEPVLWVGTGGGVARLDPGADRFVVEPGSPVASVNSFSSVTDREGRLVLWAGTYGRGLARRDPDGWTLLTARDGLSNEHITSLATTTSPTEGTVIWAGTDGGGLQRITRRRVEVLRVREGLPSDAVYSLHAMRPAGGPGILWVGTRNGGLAQLVEGTWRRLVIPVTAPAVPVNALLKTRDPGGEPALWVGTDTLGLFRFQGGRWTRFTRASGALPSDTVQCLLEVPGAEGGSTLWVGTRNGGLARYRSGRWTVFSTRNGALPNDMVQALATTPRGDGGHTLWVGTRQGMARLHGDTWSHLGTADGLPDPSVTALLGTEDPGGRPVLLAGTAGGLAEFRDGTWHALDPAGGLLNDSIQCLMERTLDHGRRTLWVGTDGGGVSVLDPWSPGNPVLFTLTDTTDPALPNNVVYGMAPDRKGRIYLATNRGVARLTPRPGEGDGPESFTVFTFDTRDGLPLNEGNRGAVMMDPGGRIWVGTVGGAAVFDPATEQPDRSPDPLLLEATLASGGGALRAGARLPHDAAHVIFRFALLSFHDEELTRYRTRLAGLDPEPSPWQAGSHREYRTLPAGEYRFQVWGRDAAGNVSGPLECAFSVAPAPWLTWWAFLGYALLVFLAGFLLLQLRLRAHRARERELQILVASRTRRLEEANELLVELSYADALTGVGNRRRFDELLDVECRRAVRARQPISLILADIDLFKLFNDSHGHQQGDACIRRVAARLADTLPRAGDTICRYGGDEFAVLLPGTDLDGALRVAEQLRAAVEALEIPVEGSAPARVTISCGVGSLENPAAGRARPADLVEMADRGLYRAKELGRNRVAAGTLSF